MTVAATVLMRPPGPETPVPLGIDPATPGILPLSIDVGDDSASVQMPSSPPACFVSDPDRLADSDRRKRHRAHVPFSAALPHGLGDRFPFSDVQVHFRHSLPRFRAARENDEHPGEEPAYVLRALKEFLLQAMRR